MPQAHHDLAPDNGAEVEESARRALCAGPSPNFLQEEIVSHFDAQELRQYLHQVMATFSKTGKEVVMVVDRSGIHRAHKLDATLDHYHSQQF